MPPKKKAKKEKAHDFMPDFMKNLNEVIELYEKEGSFRATSLTNAAKSLHGHIITSVDDIETYKLINLRGVGSSTIEMLKEFIQFGKIKRLEELIRFNYMPGFIDMMELTGELHIEEANIRANTIKDIVAVLREKQVFNEKDAEELVNITGIGGGIPRDMKEFIKTGQFKAYRVMAASVETYKMVSTIVKKEAGRKEPVNPEQAKWFATLSNKQAELLKDWYDKVAIYCSLKAHDFMPDRLKYLKEQTELIKHEIEKKTIELVEKFRE
jgi:DNA polymerase/3'-5' exonuclease PolX